MQSDMGKKIQELLLRGEAIPEDMVITMIENKINSPEVAHHGRIITLSHTFLQIKYLKLKYYFQKITSSCFARYI